MKNTKHKKLIHHHVRRHVKLMLVPHRANDFRPRLVRSYGVLVLLGLAGLAFITSNPSLGSTSVLGAEETVSSQQLLDDTNNERQKDNLPALAYNETLSAAAFLKAQDMFNNQYWAHVSPSGTTPWQWFSKAGYNYAYAGENLAKNFTTAAAATTAWMASPTHRKNILDEHYTQAGFAVMDGVLNGKHAKIIVALYGKPASPAVAGATAPAPTTTAPVSTETVLPITRFGIALQSMTPAVLGSVALLSVAAVVALVAHTYRRQLPLSVRRSWRYHHGLYKSAGLMGAVVVLVVLYSGGQI
jgi:uncharacterized protein YkwD